MGSDKALLEIDGEPLLVRSARILSGVTSSVTVVGDPSRHAGLGLEVIPDRPEDIGGRNLDYMTGFVTALEHSRAEWTLIISADMPFLTGAWLRYLVERAIDTDVDLATRGLCLLYRTSCLPRLLLSFDEAPRRFSHTMRYLNCLLLTSEDSAPFDPDGWLFADVDTPEEFEMARDRLAGQPVD